MSQVFLGCLPFPLSLRLPCWGLSAVLGFLEARAQSITICPQFYLPLVVVAVCSAYNTSYKLSGHCQLSCWPLHSLERFSGRKGFYGFIRTLWSRGLWPGHSCRLSPASSSNCSGSRPDRPRCHIQTLRRSPCPLRSAINILIAVLLPLLCLCFDQALYFQKELGLSVDLSVWVTEQSFTSHTSKCKISKRFDIAGLMKWVALLCCNYRKRSEP